MKKTLSLLLIVVASLTVKAQKTTLEDSQVYERPKNLNNHCYLRTAAYEFHLSAAKRKSLDTLFLEKLVNRSNVRKKMRRKEITSQEGRAIMREVNREYHQSFAKLVGKTKDDIQVFEAKAKKMCNKKVSK